MTKSPMVATVAWFVYSVAAVLLAILTCWALYSHADYGYRFWYQQLDIAAHIDEYGPQNRYKSGFETLSPEQHQQAFSEIRQAVHNQGEALADIRYTPPGKPARPLLRPAEVQHLEDVARLLDVGRVLMVILLLLLVPLAWCCIRLGLPSMRWRLGITVFTVGAVLAWLFVAGPTQVFYQFHLWFFPADHQWFFYWQDSLMSTLMKAPVLFGGIAAVIALGALLLLPLIYWAGLRLATRLHR